MNNNLKTDVFVSYGDDMLQPVVDHVRESGAQYIRSGQKRVVWAQSQSEQYVYKMPYNAPGIIDNAIEVLFYKVLLELRNRDAITNADLELFTRTEMFSNDLFTIRAERADFIGNVAVQGKSIAEVVLSNYDWTADYNRIQQILGQYFVLYDATIFKEPMNFGFINRNGRQRLVLLDAGSIIPKINIFSNFNATLKCPNCGRDLIYRYDNIQAGNMNQIKAGSQVNGGLYSCTTPGCDCHIDTSDRLSPHVSQIDLYVYDSYMKQNKAVIEAIIAAYTGLYVPDRNGMTYSQYKQQYIKVVNSVGEQTDETRCASAYALYIDHVGATMVASDNDVFAFVVALKRESANKKNISYSAFKNELQKVQMLNGTNPILHAWMYISMYIGTRDSQDTETWARFMIPDNDMNRSANLLNQFFGRLNIPNTNQDIQMICNDLKI